MNWATIFDGVPDFVAELVASCEGHDQEWSEWRWSGTRTDGDPLDMAGVTVVGVSDGRIAWGRLYMEPVEPPDEDIDAAVRRMTGAPSEGD